MKFYLFLAASFLCLGTCYSCTENHPSIAEINKASLVLTWNEHPGDKVIIIYDFDIMRRQYDYRAVKLTTSTGDPLRDVVEVFLKENYYSNNMKEVSLKSIEENNGVMNLNFSGKTRFKVKKEKEICLKALLLTIAKYDANLEVNLNMK